MLSASKQESTRGVAWRDVTPRMTAFCIHPDIGACAMCGPLTLAAINERATSHMTRRAGINSVICMQWFRVYMVYPTDR